MKTAVVTGASSGIGEAFAKMLAHKGTRVILIARRRERLEALKEAILSGGGQADVWQADLTQNRDLEAICDRLRQEEVDLLVNNAGFGLYGPVTETDPDREQSMIQLNVSSLVSLTRAVLPQMVDRGSGGIIQIASTSSFLPTPYMTAYGATKAFVLHYSEGLAAELKGTGVTITTVCPGSTQSEFAGLAGFRQTRLMASEEVARQALLAFQQKRITLVTGVGNWFLTRLPRFLPRTWMGALVARLFRDRT
ncbi:SDR family NAD(P)-dependent oxidoreductase [Desmospora profundinema]|uniref:NADP-dependent 3-hydroxy acid dehydrogenase YdfG n=1 Tax=Desmospora profundinema TaxID=1571184 RepID=A0ABU1IPU1_9BACL|nr:SDR family oxidoreductase [Desmospora profundinema]MDR6225775.1 short-subunit dehydrogenase [Desmospora profundinema]